MRLSYLTGRCGFDAAFNYNAGPAAEHLEHPIDASLGLLRGDNTGKMLVRLAAGGH